MTSQDDEYVLGESDGECASDEYLYLVMEENYSYKEPVAFFDDGEDADEFARTVPDAVVRLIPRGPRMTSQQRAEAAERRKREEEAKENDTSKFWQKYVD